MAPPRKHDEATRQRVVEMYKAGAKMDAIERETGVPRPTVYLILEEKGVGPSRLPTLARRAGGGVEFVMARLLETHEELVTVRAALAEVLAENERLKAQIARKKASG
jgi:transposase-like protein